MTDRSAKIVRRYKPYPLYKKSDIEWLAMIPAHWELKALKHLTRFTTGWTPPTGRGDLYDGDHLWANIGDLGPKLLYTTEKTISAKAIHEARLQIAPAGSLLFSFKLSIGTVSIAGADMYTNEAIAAFTPSPLIDTKYLYWAAPLLVPQNAQDNIYGAPLLSRERIATALVLHPPPDEQHAIGTFLGRETERIDALVAKKERLIELLHEERTAVITRAVTKGLSPNVPMKYSGAEWVGEIPAHWDVRKIKRMCIVRRGASPRPIDDPIYFEDEGEYAWVRISDVTASERYLEQTTQRLSPLGKSKSVALEPGELFLSIAATVGKPVITRIKCCIHDGFVYFVGLHENREFLFYLFSCGEAYKGLGKLGTQLNLNTDTIGDICLPRPPSSEQEQIVRFLDRETSRIDALVRKVTDAIHLLVELRTALISAAVTGKIDVRESA